MAKGRIDFPTNTEEQVAFVKLFTKKHSELKDTSPLYHLKDFQADGLAPAADEILSNHEKAEDATRRAKAFYASRNEGINTMIPEFRRAVNFLRVMYNDDPHQLADWGIDLKFTTPPPPLPTEKKV